MIAALIAITYLKKPFSPIAVITVVVAIHLHFDQIVGVIFIAIAIVIVSATSTMVCRLLMKALVLVLLNKLLNIIVVSFALFVFCCVLLAKLLDLVAKFPVLILHLFCASS